MQNIYTSYPEDEPSYTRSLTSIFIANPKIFAKIFMSITEEKFPFVEIKNLTFTAEKACGAGRLDIFCISQNYLVIFEAKIGDALVEKEQYEKYTEEYKSETQKNKYFITLTESPLQEIPNEYNGFKFFKTTWKEICIYLERKEANVNLSKNFALHIKESMKMKDFDIEIWAVVVRDEQKENLEKHHIYLNNKYHNPLFIAPREWARDEGKVTVQKMYPVKEIIKPESNDRLQKIYDMGLKNIPSTDYIYVLGSALVMEEPVKKSFKHIANSAIALKLSELS